MKQIMICVAVMILGSLGASAQEVGPKYQKRYILNPAKNKTRPSLKPASLTAAKTVSFISASQQKEETKETVKAVVPVQPARKE